MIRVGCDLAAVEQVDAKLRANPDFWRVFLTEREWEHCRAAGSRAQRAAGRWAAKEAVVKVLRPSRLGFGLTEIEILPGPGGAPVLTLHGAASGLAEQQHLSSWDVSITHSGDFAAAVAVAVQQR